MHPTLLMVGHYNRLDPLTSQSLSKAQIRTHTLTHTHTLSLSLSPWHIHSHSLSLAHIHSLERGNAWTKFLMWVKKRRKTCFHTRRDDNFFFRRFCPKLRLKQTDTDRTNQSSSLNMIWPSYRGVFFGHLLSYIQQHQSWPYCSFMIPSQTWANDHLQIATTCQQRPPFWGPKLDFYYINDLWTTTICQQRPLFWGRSQGLSLHTSLTVMYIFIRSGAG